MPKRGAKLSLPQFLKAERAIAPSSFAHEVVLVKFELQIHMEHLSSCQFGFIVVFVRLNLQFSDYLSGGASRY